MRESGEDMVIVDGRTVAEFQKMNIPGGICCPNGELALRIGELVPDPKTKIVVNCAGRTRSIIGAQTLIDFGVPNPIVALENGTQGWFLAGLKLENGASAALRRGAGSRTWLPCKGAHARLPRRAASRSFPPSRSIDGSRTRSARPTCSMSGRPRNLQESRAPASCMRRAASSCRRPTTGSARAARASCCSTTSRCARP